MFKDVGNIEPCFTSDPDVIVIGVLWKYGHLLKHSSLMIISDAGVEIDRIQRDGIPVGGT